MLLKVEYALLIVFWTTRRLSLTTQTWDMISRIVTLRCRWLLRECQLENW